MNLESCMEELLSWYAENKRDLPWRQDKNPYKIWISEIMLQQTRVEAVKFYFERFVKEIPDSKVLSQIEEDKLLKLWEGLGYYSRARNLKKAAIQIVEEHHGIFPTTYQELLSLAGIGEYTAAAIASIAFNEQVPAVDGNVLRVMMRVLNSYDNIMEPKNKKYIFQLLLPIMTDNPGDLNQAFMDLGATICIPNGKPLCEKCPIQKYCLAHQKNTTTELPIRIKKQKKKIEYYTVALIQCNHKWAIERRPTTGVLAGLFAFPSIEGIQQEDDIKIWLKEKALRVNSIKKGPNHKHIFTHKIWYMESYFIDVEKENKKFIWCTKEELQEKYAIPSAYQKYKEDIINENMV